MLEPTVSPHEDKKGVFTVDVIEIGLWIQKSKNWIMEWKCQIEQGIYPALPLTQATINSFSNPIDTFFYIYSLPNSGIQVNFMSQCTTSASQIHPGKSQTKAFALILKSSTPDLYLFLWWPNSVKYHQNVKDDIYMTACTLVVAMY